MENIGPKDDNGFKFSRTENQAQQAAPLRIQTLHPYFAEGFIEQLDGFVYVGLGYV